MEISVGAILEGNIKSITKFGAFVSLPGGRSGLVHISEIAHSYVADVKDFLTEGQEVKVKVVSIDEAGRINLSIKKATPPPARPPRPAGVPRRNGEGQANGGRPYTPRTNEGEEGERPRYNNNNRSYNNTNNNRERSNTYTPRVQQPKEPATFEDRLKQFMAESDSRQSDLSRHGGERRTSRRGNGRNRGY